MILINRLPPIRCLIILLLCVSSLSAKAETATSTPIVLQWVDLMPDQEKSSYEASREHLIEIPQLPDLGVLNTNDDSDWLKKPSIGSSKPVDKHDNQLIEIIGYPVPSQSEAVLPDTSVSFLLVPELGAGLYQPLPSPNQTVLVSLSAELIASRGKAAPSPQSPIKITGTLIHQKDPTKPYAYILYASDLSW